MAMTTAGTAGELGGKVLGGVIGGAIGSILGPLGTLGGRWVGSKLGGMGGRAAAEALSSAMTGANTDADAKAEEDTETCETCRSQQCQDLEADINRRLYNSKRSPGANGYHGQFPRRAEQICGANGPGTDSWVTHDRILSEQSGQLKKLKEAYEAAGCKGHPDENINWDDLARAQSDGFRPSDAEWLGPNNAQCQTAKELIRQNRGREAATLVDTFPRPTGPVIY
jgi:hypothetical protein